MVVRGGGRDPVVLLNQHSYCGIYFRLRQMTLYIAVCRHVETCLAYVPLIYFVAGQQGFNNQLDTLIVVAHDNY